MAKITDPSNLLPSTKSTAITKIGKGSFISPIKISKKTTSITKGLIGEGSDKDTVEVNNKLLKVEKFLKSDLITSKKKAETRRKEKEREDFKKEEEKLEAPKEAKKFNLPGLNVPGMSFLDRIKRFLFFTALGWLFTKFQDQLPKLEGIVKTIGQVYGVAEGIFKSLLNGLVNFIDIGYQTYDGLRKKVEDLGGKDAAKTFDEFSGHLNKLINGAIIAATLIASTNPKILKTPKQSKGPSGAAAAGGGRGRPGAGFTDPGRYRASGQARAGGFELEQARKNLPKKPVGPKGPLDRIGRGFKGAAAQLETGTLFKKGAGLQKALYNAPGKLKGLVPKGGGGALSRGAAAVRLPVVGPLVTFIVRRYVYGEKPSRAAAAAVGTAIGEMIGMFGGAAIAGGGTFFTGGLGAVAAPFVIGGLRLAGALAGEWIATKLYDFVTGAEVPKPQLKAAGGSVSNSGRRQRPATRSIRITRNKRPPKVKPQVSQPGKNVGGKKKIKELYPDPSARVDIEGEQKSPWYDLLPKDKTQRDAKLKKLPNPYKALTSTAKILKDIPFGIGALMGGAVDIALGQKLPEDAIRGLGNGITYLINSIASRQMSASISNIEKEIVKMQTGGLVPRLRDFTREDSMNTGEGLTKSLNNLIQQKVDQAIKEVQKQMMPGRFSEGGTPPRPGTTPPGTTPPGTTPPGTTPPGTTPTGEGLNKPDLNGKSGYQGSTNVVDIGLKDYKGRSIRLNPNAAKAFKQMIADGMPFKSSEVTSVYRDEAEYLRLVREGYNPESNSSHNYGEGADIQGGMNQWIKKNGQKYGWYYIDYPGTHGGHFEWKGIVKKQQPQKQPKVSPIFQPPGQTPPAAPGQQPLNPIFQRPGQTPPATPGQQPAKKSYSGLTSFYGTNGNEPEKPPRDGFGYDPGKKTTASGAPFIPSGLTAAHKTLPFGTKLRVTNPNNGKSVIVTVNDRGPFSGNRVLDLSYGAAKSIGMVGSGTINAKIEELKGGGYVTSPNGQRIREFITPGTKDKMPTILDKMPTPMEIRKKNFFEKGSIASYPSYSDGGMMIAIQPIIIEKTVPVPMRSSRGISFPVAGVNNSMGNSSSLNQG